MNEEEGEWLGRHDHPLLNNVILENFFQYVRRCDLPECRGVSKKWNESALPFTRSKFNVDIHFSSKIFNNRRKAEKKTRKIEDFVAVFSKNELGIPFVKFYIEPFCTTSVIGQQFLKLCGDTTTVLELRQHAVNFKVTDVADLLRSMKKLKKLMIPEKLVTTSGNVVELFPGSKPNLSCLKSFTLEADHLEGPNTSCATLIEELLTAAENISDLTLGDSFCASPDDNKSNSNSFQALSVIERLGRESSIRNLTLARVKVDPHVEILRRMAAKPNGLKLKQLSFSMDDKRKESDHFQLVELFKDTLEDLEMSSSCTSFMNFPRMLKLGRLNLKIFEDFDSTLVNLNKIFPVLRELELCQEAYGQGKVHDEFLPQSEPCPTVESLCLGHGLHLRINAFNHVLTIFPKLTELVIRVQVDGVDILRQIWIRMTQLEIFCLYGELQNVESMDSCFTGISTESIQEISDPVKDLHQTTVQCRGNAILQLRNQHCQLPSIGNLTNLRRLELNVCGNGDGIRPSYLSDVSGFLGFYSLKHLTRLVVRKSELSKTCCEILTTEMEAGIESWEFSTPEFEAIIPHSTY